MLLKSIFQLIVAALKSQSRDEPTRNQILEKFKSIHFDANEIDVVRKNTWNIKRFIKQVLYLVTGTHFNCLLPYVLGYYKNGTSYFWAFIWVHKETVLFFGVFFLQYWLLLFRFFMIKDLDLFAVTPVQYNKRRYVYEILNEVGLNFKMCFISRRSEMLNLWVKLLQ